ncbi:uncharacterized protein LOC126909541 [Daktulosphaira vitifoliae]|uniref:uncharacterized protein LOC126909541 n=1 Tax=Daktulosphaira vitifoliae TaxID=58002 RepID=UPI0021AA1EDF|nr:uncharacterized protein LOC126909541 [Daktulosphaira vitifoliae]
MKCETPSYVSDFLSVISWHTDTEEIFYPGFENVVSQEYASEVVTEYVIRGNAVILKCTIPSFVADFVAVHSWISSEGQEFNYIDSGYVVNQNYETELMPSEYVIRGNSLVLKCNIPSFVADFVTVDSWVSSDGQLFTKETDQIVEQLYQLRVNDEFVLNGNTAVLKCIVPSFIGDFLEIKEWISDSGDSFLMNEENNGSPYDVLLRK